jgi:hypothetical protein
MASDNHSPFFTFRRLLSLVLLLVSVIALYLALKKPRPAGDAPSPAVIAANAESFQTKVDQLAEAQAQGQTGSAIRLTGDEVAAALAQANSAQQSAATPMESLASDASARQPAPVTTEAIDAANLREPVVTFEGDVVRGQFTTEVSVKTVYITVSGHLGAKEGYATFEPTEFKIGDLSVPVSLVNPALQKKLLEQRDRMKLPEFVSDVRVENGELVVKQK